MPTMIESMCVLLYLPQIDQIVLLKDVLCLGIYHLSLDGTHWMDETDARRFLKKHGFPAIVLDSWFGDDDGPLPGTV